MRAYTYLTACKLRNNSENDPKQIHPNIPLHLLYKIHEETLASHINYAFSVVDTYESKNYPGSMFHFSSQDKLHIFFSGVEEDSVWL